MLDIEEKNINKNKNSLLADKEAFVKLQNNTFNNKQSPINFSLKGEDLRDSNKDNISSLSLSSLIKSASTRVKVPGVGKETLILSLVSLVISAVFYLVLVGLAKGVSNNIEQLKRQIGDLERKINSEENQTLVEKYKTLNSQLKTYKTLLNSRVYPARLIKIVLLRYPKRSLFESIDFKEDGSLSFSGRALSLTDVAKAYVALRDYVLLELKWRGGDNSPDINEALNAFSVSKGDVIGFLLPENRAVVIFTQPEPEKFQPLKDPYIMANLKNWEVLRVAPVFSDLQLTSISSEKKSESEANFLASIMKSYTFSVKADPLLFAPPVQSDSLSGEVGHAY